MLAAAAAAVVAVYAAVGFWLVPRILRGQAQDFASRKYGREVTLGEIRFNPFTFRLEVEDFSFPDDDGEPLVRFEQLVVNLELSSLWRRGASFKEISLEQPYIRPVIRANGELNFVDLARPFPPEPAEEDEEPPRVFIGLFRLANGHAHFEDRTLATPYVNDLRPLDIELRDFSTTARTDNAYELQARAGSGATLDWSGEFSLAPLGSAGRFRFTNVGLSKHWGYARENVGFDLQAAASRIDQIGRAEHAIARQFAQQRAIDHAARLRRERQEDHQDIAALQE